MSQKKSIDGMNEQDYRVVLIVCFFLGMANRQENIQ